MKKFLTTILTIFAVLFLFGSAYAGPEQVSIVPISKWNYKNVNGYGLYAKGGEYSWFAFILRNAGNTDVTVTLPSEVDVAHNTRHKIVNTAYKAMYNGSVDINYSGYFKVYFTNSFTLPKDSTYSVFFDVTDIQPYNKQWDTDVFFSIQIKDQNTAINLPIKGVLAYDAKNTTPSRLTIVTQDPNQGTAAAGDPLTTVSFCRDLANNKVSFAYALKNNTAAVIPVELATSLAVEGQSGAVPVSYTGCTSGGSSCTSRISGGIFKLNPGETAEFKGEAALSAKPSKTDFYIQTSLRYDYNGQILTPFLVGYATGACSAGSPAPVPTPASPSTPETGTDELGLISTSFCRDYDANARRLSFSYTLKNSSSVQIPVELATSLAIEGQQNVVPLSYTGCTSGGSSCSSRISKGIFKLNAGETAEFRGEATLPSNPANANFFIKTSLRYDYNGRTLIPFLVGYTTNTCSAAHAISADEVIQKSSESGDPFWFSARVINDRDSEMTILPGAVLRGEAAFGNYEGTAAISAVDVEITGHTDVPFRNDEAFILPPYSIADISISLSGPAASDEGLIWNYTIDGTAQSFELNEGRAKGLTLGDTKAAEPEEPLRFYAIGSTQNPGTIPDFEPKW